VANDASRERTNGPQSVERALSLLTAISEAAGPVAVTEVARQVNLHPATAHRLLRALVVAGFVVQDPETSRYRLGPKLLQIANTHRLREALPQLARPVLERLTNSTGETTGLLECDGASSVVVARVVSSLPLLVHTPIGAHGPLNATGGGKVLLANMSDERREAILSAPLARFTDDTQTDPAALRRELEEIRVRRFGIGVDDYHEGVTAIAAPVFDAEDTVVAALSMPGPTSRMAGPRLGQLIELVCAAAEELSRELGATLPLPRTSGSLTE
jgi:DNA-binding IclR family transcriptional regulator